MRIGVDLFHFGNVSIIATSEAVELFVANVEHLLHEAQYAFQSISFGESRDNRRNASRAKSLCKKIIRKFPTSMEASEAHAILRRLGEEAYVSNLGLQHRHSAQHTFREAPTQITYDDETVAFDWRGFWSVLLTASKPVLAVIAFVAIIFVDIFGPLLFLPLILFVVLTGPFRQWLKPEQGKAMNVVVARANAYIKERRKS